MINKLSVPLHGEHVAQSSVNRFAVPLNIMRGSRMQTDVEGCGHGSQYFTLADCFFFGGRYSQNYTFVTHT